MTSAPPGLATTALAGVSTGLLLALSSIPGPWGPVAFVALVPLLRALDRGAPPGHAACAGLLAGLLFFGLGFAFLPAARLGGPAPQAVWAIGVALLALPVGALAALLATLRRLSPTAALAALPGAWITLELARSHPMVGVPWLHLGYALADAPLLLQSAGAIGLYGVSAWVAATNAALAGARRLTARTAPALVGLLALPLLPSWSHEAAADPGPHLSVAAVQPAIPERERHLPDAFDTHLRQLLALSDAALAEGADLLVWPESAWERPIPPGGDPFLDAVARSLGTTLLTGAWRRPRSSDPALRNAAMLATGDGAVRIAADKAYPVPLYERAPRGPAARRLAQRGLWGGRFEPGDPPSVVTLPVRGTRVDLGVLVCIDTNYPAVARRLRAQGSRLLVVIANEAATGSWPAGLQARAARFRAAELRVPVVRVANTGPSLWIDARGRTVAALDSERAASGSRALLLAGPPPSSVRVGDAPVLAACAAIGLSASVHGAMRRRAMGHTAAAEQEDLS